MTSAQSRISANSFGWGLAAGLVAATGAFLSRTTIAHAKVGRGHRLKHRALDMAAGLMQHKYPLDSMSTFLNAFHFYADDMGRQVEAHHFCIHLAHDLHQCVIFDSNKPDARLIGIEYIISKERFLALPEDEKRLWHSHHYEIKSGQLLAPGVPEAAEHAYMADLVSTYGKTFHTWQVDRHDFPYGIPQLMMALTDDGQINTAKLADRDRRFGISTEERRQNRADIPMPEVIEGANPWHSGRSFQTRLEEVAFERDN